jgi:hypothetical protein
MFNNRDLIILGTGALGSVFMLLLPLSFGGKVVAGFLVLGLFMMLALLRLGPDRVPLEEWLLRRLRFSFTARKFTYQRAGWEHPSGYPEISDEPVPAAALPLQWAVEEVGLYPLMSACLAVVGVYFIVWLARGGASEISLFLRAGLSNW